MSSISPFHLAIPVHDIAAARAFYGELFGCDEGRSSDHWVDFNFFGHQLVVHLDDDHTGSGIKKSVDSKDVPVPHFGVVLDMGSWKSLSKRLQDLEAEFVIDPYTRFEGEVGEQATFFIRDPSGNALEFKAFGDPERLFAN